MPTKSNTSNLDDYGLSIKQNIFITSLLYVSFCEGDHAVKNSILKFCSLNLSNREFKKIYKACVKFLGRLDQDVDEFNNFLSNTEV